MILPSNKTIGPWTLRPLSILTSVAIDALKLRDQPESVQVAGIAWMQSVEPSELKSALKNGTAENLMYDFMGRVPLALVPVIGDWLAEQNEFVAAQQVEVQAKPNERPEDLPKN